MQSKYRSDKDERDNEIAILPPARHSLVNQVELRGRCAVITGGAQGIGRAIAQRLLTSGAAV
ncbi:MAG TPA: hypothetical protein VGN39_16225 [Terriglobales bacterium]|nr:hypothetical protein [Terriglobales bacterium]